MGHMLICRQTFDWHLGFVYCISCAILCLMLALTIYVYAFMKRSEKAKKEVEDQIEGAYVIFRPSFKKLRDQ